MMSAASLITVGQETLLKADISLAEIPWPMGAKSSVTIHTIMQNDSCFVEGLQRKAESDIYSLDDDIECYSLDENAVVCNERSELQREVRHNKMIVGENMVFSSFVSGNGIVTCFYFTCYYFPDM